MKLEGGRGKSEMGRWKAECGRGNSESGGRKRERGRRRMAFDSTFRMTLPASRIMTTEEFE
jgi:hypothetical protein